MVGQHVLRRMTTGIEDHGGFPGYYLATSLGTFYPWSALLPAALLGAWARRRSEPVFGFLLGWVVGPLLMLECARTKLIHYYLPAYPACALLAAWLVATLAEPTRHPEALAARSRLARPAGGHRGGAGRRADGGGVGLAGRDASGRASPWRSSWRRGPRSRSGDACTGRPGGRRPSWSTTWAAILLGAGAWLLPAAEPYRLSVIVGRHLEALSRSDGARPVLATFKPPGVVYTLGRPPP